MSSEIEILVDMGFNKEKAERALNETGNMGVELAMEWLLSHPDESTSNAEMDAPKMEQEGSETAGEAKEEAKSLKCEDCGKFFAGVPEAEYHATKSGHSNFSESTDSMKPLTEEEKQAQLLKVQEMLKLRRKEREEKEKQEHLEREKARRVMGKEISSARQKYEELELKKALDQRKREKEEEKLARQRVKEQIEKDKLDREIKFAMNPTPTEQASVQPQQPQQTQQSNEAPKNYMETKLQIRLLNGDKLMETFGVQETLAAVRVYVSQKSSQCSGLPFTFSTTFPRREFSEDDMQTPLAKLGLVPSAVLMVKKL